MSFAQILGLLESRDNVGEIITKMAATTSVDFQPRICPFGNSSYCMLIIKLSSIMVCLRLAGTSLRCRSQA